MNEFINDENQDTEDHTLAEEDGEEEIINIEASGLNLLLDIIKVIHNKSAKNTGFTKPFDLTKYVSRLPYIESINGNTKLSSRRLEIYAPIP